MRQFIGRGRESSVYDSDIEGYVEKVTPLDGTHVVDVKRVDPFHVKSTYYIGKLLHILEPAFFPDMGMVSLDETKGILKSRQEKIEVSPRHKRLQEKYQHLRNQPESSYDSEFEDLEEQIGTEIYEHDKVQRIISVLQEAKLHLDPAPINIDFLQGENPVYLDRVHFSLGDKDKILEYFKDRISKIRDRKIKRRASKYLYRLDVNLNRGIEKKKTFFENLSKVLEHFRR